jgi:plasmid rolling circle replication initiator protein Rep
MEFTNDVLQDIKAKKDVNGVFSRYFYKMHLDTSEDGYSNRYKNKSERINDCMNLWKWDAYHENKVLDLKKVNRCKDNRFCPNCRKFSLASAVHNFSPQFKKLIAEGYYPYIMTITIPNVIDAELRPSVKGLNESFRNFWRLLSYDLDKRGFAGRYMKFDGALKVMELTYNQMADTYHPHLHCIVFSKEYDVSLFNKCIPGAWSNKRKAYDKYSEMDIHIMKLWKMCFDEIRVTQKNYDSLSDNWYDLYMCDIRECDSGGIWEVLKYTFKDNDIKNYKVFKSFFTALDGQRIRQGHGLLYNLKLEEDADGEKIRIEDYLTKKENPVQLVTQEINDLITVYRDYVKISRFGNKDSFDKLTENGL